MDTDTPKEMSAREQNVRNLLKTNDIVEVDGWDGTFKFKGYSKDGTALLWGGAKGEPAWRNAPVEKLSFSDKAGPATIENTAPSSSRKAGKR